MTARRPVPFYAWVAQQTLPAAPRPVIAVGRRSATVNGVLDGTPLLLLPLVDLAPGAVVRAVREVALLQAASGRFRVLVLASGDVFAAVRPLGWPVEHVMSEADLLTLDPDADWLDHAAHAFAAVCQQYGVGGVLATTAAGRQLRLPDVLADGEPAAALSTWLDGDAALAAPDEPGRHGTWRGFLDTEDAGVLVEARIGAPERWHVVLTRRSASHRLTLLRTAATTVGRDLVRRAADRGWSTAEVVVPPGDRGAVLAAARLAALADEPEPGVHVLVGDGVEVEVDALAPYDFHVDVLAPPDAVRVRAVPAGAGAAAAWTARLRADAVLTGAERFARARRPGAGTEGVLA